MKRLPTWGPVSSYKTHQLHVIHRGRRFHFVSYEGIHADPARSRLGSPPTWYLMAAGKRVEVMPESEVAPDDLEGMLIAWLEEHVFNETGVAEVPAPPPPRRANSAPEPPPTKNRRHFR